MKKHGLPLVVVLLLASCTPVADFGAYWDTGFVDPAIEGTWKKIGIPGEALNSIPGADQLLFVKDGQSYSFQAINPLDDPALSAENVAQRRKDNDARSPVRTLKIGSHLFFMMRNPVGTQGTMERYEIKGDLLLEYHVNNEAALDFLEAKHPTARNIAKNFGEGRYVVIKTFDDEVFRILSEIADDPDYWYLSCQYRKVS
jgi:hypothetical protein